MRGDSGKRSTKKVALCPQVPETRKIASPRRATAAETTHVDTSHPANACRLNGWRQKRRYTIRCTLFLRAFIKCAAEKIFDYSTHTAAFFIPTFFASLDFFFHKLSISLACDVPVCFFPPPILRQDDATRSQWREREKTKKTLNGPVRTQRREKMKRLKRSVIQEQRRFTTQIKTSQRVL